MTAATSAALAAGPIRCGIDTVEIARIERLLHDTPPRDLTNIFSAQELDDSGSGAGRAASLAARYAAKEACVKLFPRELAAGRLEPADFSVMRDGYGAPQIVCSANAARVLDQARIAGIAVSLTHDRTSASAVTLALPMATTVPLAGQILFSLLPFRRRVIVENLRRVFGAALPAPEIERLAQAHYAHLWQLIVEFFRFRRLSDARKQALVRVENVEVFADAFRRGNGVLVLAGHFGNWEVATVAGIRNYPEVRGRFHFVRRPIKPRWLDRLVIRRFSQSGLGVIAKRGSLERIVSLLERGDIVVFPFDQYAGGAGRHRRRILRRAGRDVQESCGDRARDRRAGAARRLLARAGRPPCLPVREPGAGRRCRRRERVDPPHDPRLQRGARAARAAPSGAVVVGASPLEVGAAQAAITGDARCDRDS